MQREIEGFDEMPTRTLAEGGERVLRSIRFPFNLLEGGCFVALVLCVGADDALMTSRKLLLENAEHQVVTCSHEPELVTACTEHKFDVAVIGQAVSANQKRRIVDLIREHCASAR